MENRRTIYTIGCILSSVRMVITLWSSRIFFSLTSHYQCKLPPSHTQTQNTYCKRQKIIRRKKEQTYIHYMSSHRRTHWRNLFNNNQQLLIDRFLIFFFDPELFFFFPWNAYMLITHDRCLSFYILGVIGPYLSVLGSSIAILSLVVDYRATIKLESHE